MDEPQDQGRSTGFTFVIAMGILLAVGLLTGAVFAIFAERMLIALILAAAAVVDAIAFVVLYRMDPTADPVRGGLNGDQRQAMVDHLEQLHASGELNDDQLARAKASLADQAGD